MDHTEASHSIPSGAMLIGSEWVADSSEGRREHRNPSTGAVLGSFAVAGAVEMDAAVARAKEAFPAWRDTHPVGRQDVLLSIAQRLREHQAEMSVLRTLEIGAPLKAPGGRSMAADYFTHFAGWADKLEGRTIPVGANALDYTVPEPYGVIGVLIPWNGPVVSAGMKVAPALAAGNCVVLKPSELAPFSTLRFAELCIEAGLPPGVLSVCPGGASAGEALVAHPDVGKISFTGGIPTAQRILAASASSLKPVVLELGGKSAAIIFPDADMDLAVSTVVRSTLSGIAGHACVLPTRMLVDEHCYDEVCERARDLAGAIVVGDPFDPKTQMGPVIDDASCRRIAAFIDRAVAQGQGRLLAGGKRLGGDLAGGYFIEPTIFADVELESDLAQEEIFGPVLSISPFSSEAEAVTTANGTRFGLGGFVFTSDLDRAHRVAAALQVGWVGINAFPPMPANAPFGGVKQSGFGREGGLEGLLEFTRSKNIYMQVRAQ